MNVEDKVKEINTQEKKILIALEDLGQEASVKKIQESSDLSQAGIMRSALTLEEVGFLSINQENKTHVLITEEGLLYIEGGLPERKILIKLAEKEAIPLEELPDLVNINESKIGISIGWTKRKGWAEIESEGDGKTLKITEKGRESSDEKGKDELLLEQFKNKKSTTLEQIPSKLRDTVATLKSRGLLETKERTIHRLKLTEDGKKAIKSGLELKEMISRLSGELIKSGEWKKVDLKEYNVTAPGPCVYPGKEHPQRKVIEELRNILLRMGFEEIEGPIVESEFWNFDALFQAQNHPAREIHDTLSLSKPKRTKIPDEKLLERVKKAHEEGVAGSEGWGYNFDKEISRRPILRSQTTADTVRYLAEKPKPPIKVFCVDKVFRRERIDYQHLAEFPQAEGIVMAENLNFRHMLGYLKQILVEMGITKIRFRPGYFPYTEPSAEADGYFPERNEWIELLGAGMFRPELLEPLGIEHEVLAWGIGFSRIAMIRMGIEDMRDLHNNDVEWLKERPMR